MKNKLYDHMQRLTKVQKEQLTPAEFAVWEDLNEVLFNIIDEATADPQTYEPLLDGVEDDEELLNIHILRAMAAGGYEKGLQYNPKIKYFYTVPEAAQVLHVHENTIYRQLKSGKIDFYKVGAQKRIPADEIQRLRIKRASN